jgi:hypothetical protein
LVFNPLHRWYKGPFAKLYLQYYASNVKPSSKLMALSYTFSYYAIAAALPLTFANYMFQGLMPNTLDKFYVNSWKILLIIIIIFNVLVCAFPPFSETRHLIFHRHLSPTVLFDLDFVNRAY